MAGRARHPLTREVAFWDSSALVPLCVYQTATRRVVALHRNYDSAVWWSAPVEITSAFARLLRMGQLDPIQQAKATKLAAELALAWFIVQPSEALRINAMQLVDHYDLRAADSLQLAAAVEWCEHRPKGRVFLALDQKLREAAALQGFDVPPL